MAEYLTGTLQHARQWQSVEEGSRENKQMKSDCRRVADGMQYRKSLRTFLQRLSMPKLLPQRLAVAVQVLRYVEMVFQTKGLQSMRQSVREGRNNFRGM